MNQDSELFVKMKRMNAVELGEYMHIAKVSGRACAVIGIGIILIAMIFTNMYTVAMAAIIGYITSQIACGIDELKVYINELLKLKINT